MSEYQNKNIADMDDSGQKMLSSLRRIIEAGAALKEEVGLLPEGSQKDLLISRVEQLNSHIDANLDSVGRFFKANKDFLDEVSKANQ